jgi:purine nucleoside permease
LTLRRNRECQTIRVNQRSSKDNRLDFNRLNHLRNASQDQDKQSQSCDDHEKSIEMQRQESFEKRNQREKRVKNFEKFVQFVRIKSVK